MQFIIGLDIGTTHTKAIAQQSDGVVVAVTSAGYLPITAPDGRYELDCEELLQAVTNVLQQLMQSLKQQGIAQAPSALAFSSAMHSLIAVDAQLHPLTNCITWADLRSIEQAERLRATDMAMELYRNTGTPVHAMSPLCKLIWIGETMPELHRNAASFIGIKEYVMAHMTGERIIDHSIASATGLFDIHNRSWFRPALALAGIDENRLFDPVSTDHIIQGITEEWATCTGLPQNIKLIAGASDGCLANIGSNALYPGDLSVTVGTSGAVRMLSDTPQTHPQASVFNYILDDEYFVCGGPLNNGGALLQWYAKQLLQRDVQADTDMQWFFDEAATVPSGSDGLLFLPYVRGERAPVWDAGAKAAFVGLDHRHTRAHEMRALIEGINYSICDITDAVAQTAGSIQNVFLSGGITRSPQWMQWLANAMGKPLQVSGNADASALGAAILGWKALGHLKSLTDARDFFQVAHTYQPDRLTHQLHQQFFSVYRNLYTSLQSSFKALQTIRHTHNDFL
ncbi:gluconokinase [Pseudoflavitalea sp. G-6-1-2]|uniref:gluconokinase n=1 Tax=Pseudoflavitalea sp. G-6-1-2 TaxID=2728841 RepID=UPI00146C40DC|nr:gluconokinase [Pseudoflavitalea sp. G-6-1-2]NML23303.1 gluconokinase [Pseudoflavitalea sp. G-6-1-2]